MQLAVIIVNYCTPRLAVDCLRSLDASGDLPSGTQVVVVDGHSPDDSVSAIGSAIAEKGWNGWATLLSLPVNGGFAYANNRGLEEIKTRFGMPDFVLLLNSDTVVRPGAISHLLDFLKGHPSAAIAGSRLEDPDGTPQHSAFGFPSIAGEFESTVGLGVISRLLKRWQLAPAIPDVASRADWVSGACLLMRREVIEAVGGLDDGYFLYFEETDFCLRATRKGFECWYVPESRVVHLVGKSSGVTERFAKLQRRPGYWFESRRRYFLKNYGFVYAAMADLAWLCGFALWRVRRPLLGRADHDPPKLMSDFVRQSVLLQGMRVPRHLPAAGA